MAVEGDSPPPTGWRPWTGTAGRSCAC